MPCPEGLAWLLLGCSVFIPIAKAMPKGSYGINLALCVILLKFTKLNDLKKMAIAIFIPNTRRI